MQESPKTDAGAPRWAVPSGFRRAGRLLFAIDLLSAVAAVVTALAIRFETFDPTVALYPYLPAALFPLVVRPLVFLAFGLHRREWKHASTRELIDVVSAVAIGSMILIPALVVASAAGLPGTSPFPRSFFILEPILFLGPVAAARFLLRFGLERADKGAPTAGWARRTLIYGAGDAGAIVARMADSGTLHGVRVVGFLDDNPHKGQSRLLGHRVWGRLEDIERVAAQTAATQLVIAIPSAHGDPVRAAISAAQALGITVKIVPPLRDLMTGAYTVAGIRSVSVEDLLRREPVVIDAATISGSINGASVMVTGGGGSIGGELVRQILTLGPRELTVVDNHEWALWNLERDVAAQRREGEGPHFSAVLADVRSASAMTAVMQRARPDIVFHAAALKHVPFVEYFPSEGVLTNVIGTRNVLRACEHLGIPRFVLISTDKAVEPVSVMGATKRLAERLTVAAGRRTGRAYVAVRFGNVLGSSGSVVPLLQRQLDDGLPLTITQPDATRYFMTISEAVSLILEAGASATPGEVYVLDMGEPIRIIDLARDLVRLNGFDPDILQINVTGLRPGERLHEKLFYDDESAERTIHAGIMRASRPSSAALDRRLEAFVDELGEAASDHRDRKVRALLLESAHLSGMTIPDGVEVEPTAIPIEVSTGGGRGPFDEREGDALT